MSPYDEQRIFRAELVFQELSTDVGSNGLDPSMLHVSGKFGSFLPFVIKTNIIREWSLITGGWGVCL